ncbi:MAG: hypothetical protein NZ826_02255 [Thermodesulfovibrio sp.]|nr:hypothetical protein [Thermodesulfovibrio sp.]MDW7972436.1 hypothetical protein [Thermodesulfovibrio sp.]
MRKNIKNITERMKKLKAQLKQAEMNFYAELGRSFEKELQNENCTVESLQKIHNELKEKYGMEVKEVK